MYRYDEDVQIWSCADMQMCTVRGKMHATDRIVRLNRELWVNFSFYIPAAAFNLRAMWPLISTLHPNRIATELHPYLRPKIGLLIRKWNFLLLPSISFHCSSVLLKVRLLSRSHKRPKVDSTHKVEKAVNMSTHTRVFQNAKSQNFKVAVSQNWLLYQTKSLQKELGFFLQNCGTAQFFRF